MASYESSHSGESKQERVIKEFLQKYFYEKAYPQHEVASTQGMHDKGIDIIVPSYNGPEYQCIKAQASPRYINHPNPTFSFELMANDKDGATYIGWYLRNDLETHVYVLVWVNSAKTNNYGYINDAEDIEELEILFLDKAEFKRYIADYVYDDALWETAQKMRNTRTTRIFLNQKMYTVFSDGMKEQPVNLVVKKHVLEDMAYQRFLVRKSAIQSLM